MPSPEEAAANAARTIRQLREIRGWTQQRLADLSGVPRPTLASLEAGGANPTLSVLVRVAGAFGIGLDELVSPPRASGRLYRADELPGKQRGGVSVRALLPDALPGVVVERMAFAPGSTWAGSPHTPGTREYLTCERGAVTLTAAGERWDLGPGDVLAFRGDQRHGYAAGDVETVAYSVILPV
ncbi:MAG: helix-turn-helix transcriptional regulator [Alphaproteobacteria bacterium]|nr:helix-turn-helix transcriptional regulator [Alphaproteobacteria bacterium]MCB9691511.1 helix-turn-helix transcriptional regulator [Alphaproteobacteria bacterium]